MDSTTTTTTTTTANNNNNNTNTISTTSLTENFSAAFQEIFNQNNFLYLLCFLAIYYVLYFFTNKMYGNDESSIHYQLSLSRSVDIFILIIFIFILYFSYFSLSTTDKQDLIGFLLKWTKDFYDNSTTFFSLLLSMIVFYLVVYLIRIPMTAETKPYSISFIENKFWILLLTVFIVDFFKYVFGISITDLIYGENNELISHWNNLPKNAPLLNKNNYNINPQPPPFDASFLDISGSFDISGRRVLDISRAEVFNVSNNLYSYDDAQAVCKSLGSKLANYQEIEDSYQSGGEWCNYGWSEDQMILFPTQKTTWDKLQKNTNTKNNCGRPGINGGYIANPYLKFGVNCYGVKPPISDFEKQQLQMQTATSIPKSKEDILMDEKVNYWKNNADKMVLNSFNTKNWSEY